MTAGTKVSIVIYGERRTGVVIQDATPSGIVYVRMDDTGRVKWFHLESLERVQ